MSGRDITLMRLTEVDLEDVAALLNDKRLTRHMPLAGDFSREAAAGWVATKDAQWESHGFGPWAIVIDGELAGWGGFQAEENGADFALVLSPRFWGRGEEITSLVLRLGFTELGLAEVVIALPFSRNPERVVARYGFVPDGEVHYDGVRFGQYRLTRTAWAAAADQLHR